MHTDLKPAYVPEPGETVAARRAQLHEFLDSLASTTLFVLIAVELIFGLWYLTPAGV